jgi:hypothetical protein
MSDVTTALRVAFQLIHVPSQIRHARLAALPRDVLLLLQIAAGDEEALRQGCVMADKSREEIQEAAAFFIEQILFAPNTDCYRVLGARSDATTKDLRRNMSYLLRWLHPDVQSKDERSVFARRVSLAWDALKTPERRAAYDATRPTVSSKAPARKRQTRPGSSSRQSYRFSFRRALQLLFGFTKH